MKIAAMAEYMISKSSQHAHIATCFTTCFRANMHLSLFLNLYPARSTFCKSFWGISQWAKDKTGLGTQLPFRTISKLSLTNSVCAFVNECPSDRIMWRTINNLSYKLKEIDWYSLSLNISGIELFVSKVLKPKESHMASNIQEKNSQLQVYQLEQTDKISLLCELICTQRKD